MRSEAEYRAEAAQLARQSENAKNDAHRTALLQQADTLLRYSYANGTNLRVRRPNGGLGPQLQRTSGD